MHNNESDVRKWHECLISDPSQLASCMCTVIRILICSLQYKYSSSFCQNVF